MITIQVNELTNSSGERPFLSQPSLQVVFGPTLKLKNQFLYAICGAKFHFKKKDVGQRNRIMQVDRSLTYRILLKKKEGNNGRLQFNKSAIRSCRSL